MQKLIAHSAAIVIAVLLSMGGLCWPEGLDKAGQAKEAESIITSGAIHSSKAEVREHATVNTQKLSNGSARPWWLGDLLTVLGIIIGAIVIIYQLGRQHRDKLRLQIENHREQFRIQIYQEVSKLLSAVVDKNIDTGMYAFNMPMHVHIYKGQIKQGFTPAPLQDRAMELSRRHNESLQADTELICLIERYQIVDPALDIFITAFCSARHDMMRCFMPLFTFLLEILPAEIPRQDGSIQIVNVVNPSDDQVRELERLVDEYKAASDDMGNYLYDFNVELQNRLLTNLFPNKAPRRKPLDPKFRVVSTDPGEIESLRKYFEDQTDWGKAKYDVLVRPGTGNRCSAGDSGMGP
jgi:hypothetical protein